MGREKFYLAQAIPEVQTQIILQYLDSATSKARNIAVIEKGSIQIRENEMRRSRSVRHRMSLLYRVVRALLIATEYANEFLTLGRLTSVAMPSKFSRPSLRILSMAPFHKRRFSGSGSLSNKTGSYRSLSIERRSYDADSPGPLCPGRASFVQSYTVIRPQSAFNEILRDRLRAVVSRKAARTNAGWRQSAQGAERIWSHNPPSPTDGLPDRVALHIRTTV